MNERKIDLEIELEATPEEVWAAIATGPGISAWMNETQLEEREGGAFSWTMENGPSGSGTVEVYDRPHRFVQRARWRNGALPPATLTTEWIIAAREGGSTIMRMVMSGFGDGADWDNEIEGMTKGMRAALESLRKYLAAEQGAKI